MNMRATCGTVANMSKMIQVRNVPDEVHATIKARAALAGHTLSDYILAQLTADAARPTDRELAQRVRERGTVWLRESFEDAVRAERDAGDVIVVDASAAHVPARRGGGAQRRRPRGGPGDRR